MHDAQLPQVSRLDDGPHVLDEGIAPHVVGDGAHAVACLECLKHARALLDACRERLLTDDVRAVLECQQRLLRVERIGSADVHDVHSALGEQLSERVVGADASLDLRGERFCA